MTTQTFDSEILYVMIRKLKGEVSSVEGQLDGLESGFSYKGSVATVADLPSDPAPEVGDEYTVTEKGNAKYVWNGEDWISLDIVAENLAKALGTEFDAHTSYAVGQYVMREGSLYKCINAHTAGAWDDNDFEVVALADDVYTIAESVKNLLTDKEDVSNKKTAWQSTPTDTAYPSEKLVKDSLDAQSDRIDVTNNNISLYTGNQEIAFSDPSLKQYIKTNGSTVDWTTPSTSSNTNIKWAVVECQPGDKFTINGKGGSSDRLWAFADLSKNIIKVSGAGATATNLVLVAPTSAAYLIINDEQNKSSYIGEFLVNDVNSLKAPINEIIDTGFTWTENYFITSTGATTGNVNYDLTGYIPVIPSSKILVRTMIESNACICLFDRGYTLKGYVGTVSNSLHDYYIDIPENVEYIRASCHHDGIPYFVVSPNIILPVISTIKKQENDEIAFDIISKTTPIYYNLIDLTNLESGTISSDGSPSSNASYRRSIDPIAVYPNQQYTCKYVAGYCFYDSNEDFVSGSRTLITDSVETTFTIPEDVYYIKVLIYTTYFDVDVYLNLGNDAIEEPYTGPSLAPTVSIKNKNPYYGLKYAALGDSITYGYRPRNDPSGDTGAIDSYAKVTARNLGMSFYNYGISSSTVAYVEDHNPMSRRFNDLPNDADVITIMGGANDIRQGVPVGTMDDRDDSTFYGALHVIFYGLYKKYYIDQGIDVGSKKKIIAITPLKLLASSAESIGGNGTLRPLEPYVQAIKDVAQYYSFPCLDMYNLSQLNPAICQTLQGTNPASLGIYTIYQTDGTHPVQKAANMMADLLSGFLLSLNGKVG